MTQSTKADRSPTPPPAKEKFLWVKWGAKVRNHDPERVFIGCNGERLHWARGVACIVPQRFLGVADHALEPRFTMVPGAGMKELSPVQRYPYTILREMGSNGEATEAEYEKMKAEGTKVYRDKATLESAHRSP